MAESQTLLPLVCRPREVLIVQRTRRGDCNAGDRCCRNVARRVRVGVVDGVSRKEVVGIVESMIDSKIRRVRKLSLRGTGNKLASDSASRGRQGWIETSIVTSDRINVGSRNYVVW